MEWTRLKLFKWTYSYESLTCQHYINWYLCKCTVYVSAACVVPLPKFPCPKLAALRLWLELYYEFLKNCCTCSRLGNSCKIWSLLLSINFTWQTTSYCSAVILASFYQDRWSGSTHMGCTSTTQNTTMNSTLKLGSFATNTIYSYGYSAWMDDGNPASTMTSAEYDATPSIPSS
jgi:hypothetical protein